MDWGLSLENCLTCVSLCLCSWWCDYDFVVITEKSVFWQGFETMCLIGLHSTVWGTSEFMTWDSTDVFENEINTNRLVGIPNKQTATYFSMKSQNIEFLLLYNLYNVVTIYIFSCAYPIINCRRGAKVSYTCGQLCIHGQLWIHCLCKSRAK